MNDSYMKSSFTFISLSILFIHSYIIAYHDVPGTAAAATSHDLKRPSAPIDGSRLHKCVTFVLCRVRRYRFKCCFICPMAQNTTVEITTANNEWFMTMKTRKYVFHRCNRTTRTTRTIYYYPYYIVLLSLILDQLANHRNCVISYFKPLANHANANLFFFL